MSDRVLVAGPRQSEEDAGRPRAADKPGLSWLWRFPYRRCAALLGVRRTHAAALAALALAVAVFDAAMLAILVPMGTAVATGSFDRFAGHPLLSAVLRGAPEPAAGFMRLALLMFGFALVKNAFLYLQHILLSRLRAGCAHRLADRLFSRYLRFGKAWFDHAGAGAMAAVVEYRFDVVGIFLSLSRAFSSALILAGYFTVMVLISWRLTMIAILLFPAVHFGSRAILARTTAAARRAKDAGLRLGRRAHEVLAMMPHYQASGCEAQALRQFSEAGGEIRRHTQRAWQWQGLTTRIQELAALLSLLLMLGLAMRFEAEHASQPAMLLVFFFIARLSLPMLAVFPEAAGELAERLPRAREVLAVFEDEGKSLIPEGSRPFRQLEREICFSRLTFHYPGGPAVLSDVGFRVPRGRMTALVGPTGAGKSTILHLLLRHYDVEPGMIRVDGVDLRDYRIGDLRRGMAVVSQDAPVLSGSLRSNLLFGVDRAVSAEELAAAVATARLGEVVARLPAGLDGAVGERGVTLSGGERQRVAVARALLRRAPILLLDEATSGLDPITESLVREAVASAVRGSTSLVIAHRFTTIQAADQVVVLDQGRVVQQGSLADLLAAPGLFRRMWEHQQFSI